MTSEVKQAIFKLREIIEYDKQHRIETIYDKEEIEFRNNIELMLNLVEKLEKENIELKQEQAKRRWIHVKENGEVELLFYISKDKIRELFKGLYTIEESKYAKIKTIDSDKAFKFVKDIEKLLEESE